VADPITSGDPLRPLVVAARVAHQHSEERRLTHLPDMNEPQCQGHGEDYERRRHEIVMIFCTFEHFNEVGPKGRQSVAPAARPG
jgi:hypothetical protein